jgi:hypothetical protein
MSLPFDKMEFSTFFISNTMAQDMWDFEVGSSLARQCTVRVLESCPERNNYTLDLKSGGHSSCLCHDIT